MSGWISKFATHRTASNGIMFLIILVGLWSMNNLNRQFFPDFEFNSVSISVGWNGASAEDVQEAIAIPLENAVNALSEVTNVRTTSTEGRANLRVTIDEKINIEKAIKAIDDALAGVSLPDDVASPTANQVVRYEPVADLLLYGDADFMTLFKTARQYADELVASGMAQVSITGSPSERFEIRLTAEQLLDLNMTLDQFGQAVTANNLNLPAGVARQGTLDTQLRAQGRVENLESLQQLPIITDRVTGAELLVGDIAEVERLVSDDFRYLSYDGKPAIRISMHRLTNEDSISQADIYLEWLTDKPLPEGLSLIAYNEQWRFLESRIKLILDNGLLGMMLVLLVLFIFLNTRIAIWVALGIPVTFLATFIFMDITNTSINIFSLLAFMIAVGIIVDDAIVVSEDTEALETEGLKPMEAAISAAKRMWSPVLASSLTTIAAFTPLLVMGGRIGGIMIDIPMVVICAIAASLVECFFILPGHLGHNAKSVTDGKPSWFRRTVDDGFDSFKNQVFRPFATVAIHYRWVTFSLVIAAFMAMTGMVVSGDIKLSLAPQTEGTSMSASVTFADGTPESEVNDFLAVMGNGLRAVERDTNRSFINNMVFTHRNGSAESGSINIELINDVNRPYTNQELVSKWREKITVPAGVEKINFGRSSVGLSSADITVRLSADNTDQLKAASEALQDRLAGYKGVSNIEDDLPYGSEQWRFTLTAEAKSMGFTVSSLASRLQTILDGKKIGFIQEDGQEIDIILKMAEDQASNLAMLQSLPIALNSGEWTPLASLLDINVYRGVDSLARQGGDLSIVVSADVDEDIANAREINEAIEVQILPDLYAAYGVKPAIEGTRLDEEQILSDMKMGAYLALFLIFGILAWVFESWIWPIAVMVAIPFGLTGALFGHWVLDIPVSALSLFGLFGLSGIVINDSIVLISAYKRILATGLDPAAAVVEASCQRLRAVVLTSTTTIAGLTPLLFETSFDAQFLIPMAVVMIFGLAFGTVLILLLIPGLLLSIEENRLRFARLRQRFSKKPSL